MSERGVLDEALRAFFRDKLAVAVVFGLATLMALYVWWLLDDVGALIAGIIFAGVTAQQLYRFFLQRRASENSTDE